MPATRWVPSTQERPPFGYKWSEAPLPAQEAAVGTEAAAGTGDGPVQQVPPRIRFEASNFPEFAENAGLSWSYGKIDICEDAFTQAAHLNDPELEAYASRIREGLRTALSEQMGVGSSSMGPWEAKRLAVVKSVVDDPGSRAAIHGTLRMSGLFAKRRTGAAGDGRAPRHVHLGESALDPDQLVQSVRVFTMFPQMPDPMPLPGTTPEALAEEIASRDVRMAESGRDPHKDRHGRRYTHKSTSNVSNTIHGVYLTLDATDLPGLDEVPALDLFGTKESKREWKSLQCLKVLDSDGSRIGTEDTKPTFISGFIVRQLVEDGVVRL